MALKRGKFDYINNFIPISFPFEPTKKRKSNGENEPVFKIEFWKFVNGRFWPRFWPMDNFCDPSQDVPLTMPYLESILG